MSELFNIEAEQALLGALLLNNEVYDRVSSIIRPPDFYDPVHRRIFEAIVGRVLKNEIASPVSLKSEFEDDEGLKMLGGVAYLARLCGAVVSIFSTPEYARLIVDLAQRRSLSEVLTEAQAALEQPDTPVAGAVALVETWSLAQEAKSDGKIIPFVTAVTDALRQAQEVRQTGRLPGLPSGIAALDDLIGGFCPGQMIVLGGRPSMGKSAVALQFAINAARRGHGVGFASLEMTEAELALRGLSEDAARSGHIIPYVDVRNGRVSDNDFDQILWSARSIADLPIKILPVDVRSPGSLMSCSRRLQKLFEKAGKTLDLLIVDYLQIMEATSKGNGNERITELSNATKRLARKLNIPVIVLAQLSRAVESREDKRPQLSDLRESGSIEQDADVVIFCYRASYYLSRMRPNDNQVEALAKWQEAMAAAAGYIDLLVAKQRMGAIGAARCLFDERVNWLRDTPNYLRNRGGDVREERPVPDAEGFA